MKLRAAHTTHATHANREWHHVFGSEVILCNPCMTSRFWVRGHSVQPLSDVTFLGQRSFCALSEWRHVFGSEVIFCNPHKWLLQMVFLWVSEWQDHLWICLGQLKTKAMVFQGFAILFCISYKSPPILIFFQQLATGRVNGERPTSASKRIHLGVCHQLVNPFLQ